MTALRSIWAPTGLHTARANPLTTELDECTPGAERTQVGGCRKGARAKSAVWQPRKYRGLIIVVLNENVIDEGLKPWGHLPSPEDGPRLLTANHWPPKLAPVELSQLPAQTLRMEPKP